MSVFPSSWARQGPNISPIKDFHEYLMFLQNKGVLQGVECFRRDDRRCCCYLKDATQILEALKLYPARLKDGCMCPKVERCALTSFMCFVWRWLWLESRTPSGEKHLEQPMGVSKRNISQDEVPFSGGVLALGDDCHTNRLAHRTSQSSPF